MNIDERIAREIREEVPEDKYGVKKCLMNPIKVDKENGYLYVRKKRGSCKDGYDCVDASIATKVVLDRNDIDSTIFKGHSEDGLFDNSHYFLVDDDYEIIDATPLYPLVGAKHLPTRAFPTEFIHRAADTVDITDGCIVGMKKKNDEKYLTTAAAPGFYFGEGNKKLDEVIVGVRKMGDEIEIMQMIANINEDKIKTLRKHGLEPLEKNSSLDEVYQRLHELRSVNAINYFSRGCYIYNRNRWDLETYEEIGDDLKDVMRGEMDIFLHFIESVPFVQY